jgi:NADH:ubiquinone oxidoreductase subunit E
VHGAADLARQLESRLALRLDDPAGDGTWSLQQVSCLGACGQAPVLEVDGAMVIRLPVGDPLRLAEQLEQAGVPMASGGAP